jgi:tight adherence protein C
VHNFTLQHAARFKNPAYRQKLSRLILTSGLSSELNVDEFIGLQILWGIIFPIILFVLNFALQLGFPWFVVIGLGLFGYQIPRFHARKQKKDRQASVLADLPFFIDLLALSTAAGSDFIGAIQRIVEKADNSVLAQELSTVLKDLKLGSSRADSLRALADRLDIIEIQSFAAMIIDAEATGASISKVLQAQSEQIRLERFVRAEKAGARASQAILIPMMVFILPAVFLMVFGPVVLQFFYGGNS